MNEEETSAVCGDILVDGMKRRLFDSLAER